MKIPHVHRKTAKGRTYYYFATGQTDERGKPVLKRLPDIADPMFGTALATANRLRTIRAKPKASVLTVAKMVDLYQRSPQFAARSQGTRTSYNHYLKQIVAEMGIAPADEVRRKDAMALMDKRGKTPAAANQIVRVLGALYAWGRGRELVTARPTDEIKLNKIGEHEPWPETLVEEALASDDELVSLSAHLLYFTAQRLGDTLRMRWSDIRGNRIAVKQEKGDKPLEIALHERLAGKLAGIRRRGLTILAREDGRAYRQDTVRKALQAFAEKRGCKIVPHGLRKNAVNSLLEIGCSTWEVQAISGQSPQVIEHYAKKRDKTKLGDAAILRWNRK